MITAAFLSGNAKQSCRAAPVRPLPPANYPAGAKGYSPMGQKQPPTFTTSAAELAATTDADGRNYRQCVIVSQQSTVGRANPATGVSLISRRRGRRPWLRRGAGNGLTHRSMLARKTVTSHERRQSRLCRIQEFCIKILIEQPVFCAEMTCKSQARFRCPGKGDLWYKEEPLAKLSGRSSRAACW